MASNPSRAKDTPPSEGTSKRASMASKDSKAVAKKNHGQNRENILELGLELEAATNRYNLVGIILHISEETVLDDGPV